MADIYSESFWELFEELDASLDPGSPELLYEVAAPLLGAGHRILDVGCRDARHLIELARRHDATGVGVDPVPWHVQRAQAAISAAGLSDQVSVRLGAAEDLVEEPATFDIVWCRDVIEVLPDLATALAQMRRVLRPGGHLVAFTNVLHGPVDAAETASIHEPLGNVIANLVEPDLEVAFSSVGFTISVKHVIGTEWREYLEEHDQVVSHELLRLARLRRNRESVVARYGPDAYRRGQSAVGRSAVPGQVRPGDLHLEADSPCRRLSRKQPPDLDRPARRLCERVAVMADGADLSVVYSGAVDEVLAAADASRQPQSLNVIYDFVSAAGADSNTVVVDAGCATGERARELIRRTGCRIEGVELLPRLIEWGIAQTAAAGMTDRLHFQQGSILALPIPDGHADLVMCTDVLGLIDDLSRAVAECARVLKPGGAMVCHVTVATDRMAPFEQAELDASQGTIAASMNRTILERTLAAQFVIEQVTNLGSQHRLYAIETGDDETLVNLVRASRLITWPAVYRADHGNLAYRTALTEALWGTYQLLGKLSPIVYLLRRQ